MSSDNLNNKIINNVRDKIIISNIKGENEKMLSGKKKILAIASCVVILAGGYVSVDAANNGEITNAIKEKISSFVVKADGQEKELQPSKEENGYVFYEYEKDDKKIEIVVDEDELENLNSNIEIKSTEDGEEEVTFSDEYEGNYVMIHSDIDIFQ